ncbi:SDR family NAD(P)-dependent oxidoreductase [Methanosphaerula palustris]|uniref:Short-chain dehydrogenase/reductase SDR n=1 Tax=Methanosphaerula palustris (strain ATCC BAA-1556 / DSM 19958 / E1-9c) TaxID=521011 RepID=B8GHZ2_METPE|nr:glucose 1-dehydrogenase [Methanosphaerula palustris]ACL16732.1 short-chain dehydrogenase/reductase SDR [Methanosphaerula palustris E1-9c]
MGRLNNKVCIVTGSTSGIGEACAKDMAAEGGKLVVSGRNEKEGARVVNEIKAMGGEAIFVRADVVSEDDIKNLIAKAVEAFGKLDVMVANSGIAILGDPHEVEVDDWDKVLNVNLKGVFLCDKYAVIQMLKQGNGGAIVNTGSIHSFVAKPGTTSYAAAKGGVAMLTRTVGTSYATRGIRANFVAPGYVDTPLLSALPPEVYQDLVKLHPIGRLAKPVEVAKAVTFLASDDASDITGTSLLVDGGYSAV